MKRFRYLIVLFFCCFVFCCLAQKPFTAGNIVVYRVGDGTAALDGNASRVFLDEYTASGTLVQSLQMPVTGQKVTYYGSVPNGGGGMMTLSTNGKYLVVPGYNIGLGIPSDGSDPTVSRDKSIGLVDFNGSVSNVTVMSNPNSDNITSAT